MAITYPLAYPTTPKFKRLVMKAITVAGQSISPFTLQQQTYLHQGEAWAAEVTLPLMARAEAEAWIAWGLALRGKYGTFGLSDPSGATPRGSALGNPGSVDGAAQLGLDIDTLAWTASQSNILLPGDYIQIAKNYLTNPRAFDNALWIKHEGTVTSTTITAPNGVAEAERVISSAGATNTVVYQIVAPVPSRLAGETFTGSVWLKAAAGTPSIPIELYDGVSYSSLMAALTTTWQRFSLTRTFATGATNAQYNIGGLFLWTEAIGPIDMWGAALYAPALDARLHKVLVAASTDANRLCTLDIWPRLREATVDFSAVITSSAQGLFRLSSNVSEWDINEALQYGMGFSAMEAI